MNRIRVVVSVAALGLLTGLGGSASAHPVKRVHGFHQFQSPSGNLGCGIVKQVARCDIKDRDWKPPKAPKNCHLDYGQGLEVLRHGKGRLTCAGDTELDPKAPVLAYGHSISVASMRCASKPTGMVCKDRKTGHGFAISKESYRTF